MILNLSSSTPVLFASSSQHFVFAFILSIRMSSSPTLTATGPPEQGSVHNTPLLITARLTDIYSYLTKGLTDAEAVTATTLAALSDQNFKIKQQQLEHTKTALALAKITKDLSLIVDSHTKQGEALAATTANLQKHLDMQQAHQEHHQRMRAHLRRDIGRGVLVELLGMSKETEEALYTKAKTSAVRVSKREKGAGCVSRSDETSSQRSTSPAPGAASTTISRTVSTASIAAAAHSVVVPPLVSLLGNQSNEAHSQPTSTKAAVDVQECSGVSDDGEKGIRGSSGIPAGIGALTARPSVADVPNVSPSAVQSKVIQNNSQGGDKSVINPTSPYCNSLGANEHIPSLGTSFGGSHWQGQHHQQQSHVDSFSRSISRAESPVPNQSITNASLSRSGSPAGLTKRRETLSVSPATAPLSTQLSQHSRHSAPARRQSMSASPEASLEAFVAFSDSKESHSFTSPVSDNSKEISTKKTFERPSGGFRTVEQPAIPVAGSQSAMQGNTKASSPLARPTIVSSIGHLLVGKDKGKSSSPPSSSASPLSAAAAAVQSSVEDILAEHGGQRFWATEAAIREDAPVPVVMALVKRCGGPRAVYLGVEDAIGEANTSSTRARVSSIDGLGGFLGATAFHFAAYHGRDDVLEALCKEEGGSEIRIRDKKGYLPLHEAVRADQQTTVHWLIKGPQQVSVNARCLDGASPIHIAAMNGLMSMTTLLIALGSDLNGKTINGLSPLHAATVGRCAPLAALLIERGADVNAKDNVRRTPLHQAAASKDEPMVRTLLSLGASTTDQDSRGAAPDLSWLPAK